MYSGGVAPATQRGQLFAEPGAPHFNIHAPNGALRFQTNNLLRMQLNPAQNNTINGFTVATDGFLGLGRFLVNNTAPGTPWTRLHLHDTQSGAGIIQFGFRDWMRNGVTMTGHGDHMYIGHKYGLGTNDPTDAVFQWADNGTSQQGPDLMRFIFTSNHTGASTGSNSAFGQEIMQLHPQGLIGLGDWNAASVVASTLISPTERLDLLDGRARIRQLPLDLEADQLTKFMVVDDLDPNDPEYGVVKWRYLPTGTGGACDWIVQSSNNVSNTYTGSTCPWDLSNGVGIGIQDPKFKLQVYHADNSAGLQETAIWGSSRFFSQNQLDVIGVHGEARSNVPGICGINAIGVLGYGTDGKYSTGVAGRAGIEPQATGTVQTLTGVSGIADAGTGDAVDCIGVYGKGAGAANENWAGYFAGDVQITGDLWNGTSMIFSDQSLKTDIEALPGDDAMDLLAQLEPKTYAYSTAQYPQLALSEGLQYGFLAQQVEEVIPALVASTTVIEERDSLGNVTAEAFDVKGINYVGMIPLLVAAHQAGTSRLAAMEERLAQQDQLLIALQAQLAACCTNPDGTGSRMRTEEGPAVIGEERNLRIQPNPVGERTTVYYTLERGGRMQLLVNSTDGKQLRQLSEATQEAGQYQYEWNTGNLSPGMYYVTLLLDGEPIVKRAVKL